jgi:bifunctional DNA-binding transcriptional regulator/antitoxin component of YhaV-PrlF toxin-antitoxin module
MRKMPIVEVDKDYKIPLKQISDSVNIKPADRFMLRVETKEKIILEKMKQKDSLIEIIEKPAHVDRERMNLDLKKLEEEMWTE